MMKAIGHTMTVIGTACWVLACGAAEPLAPPATPPSGQPAKELTLDLGNKVTMKLVLIPAGKFMMGSPAEERGRKDNESNPREVTIGEPFYMGVYTVTQKQYEQVMGTNPSWFKGAANPVETVSWNDAVEFCAKVSQMTGRHVTLPTEAQWEYSCRAGTTTPFYTGNTISVDKANYNGNAGYFETAWKRGWRQKTAPVGSFRPNAFGLYDMHGNVAQWCLDWVDTKYVAHSPITDPPPPNDIYFRVIRGSGWDVIPVYCRSASRGWNKRDYHKDYLGFRVVVQVGEAEPPAIATAGQTPGKTPTTKPAKAATSRPGKTPKYEVPTDAEVQESQKLMAAVLDQATKEVNPNLHKVETAHFVIYSGLPATVDTGIGKTMERMYQVLRKQFELDEDERVWVGKCGIFLLSADPDRQFFNFATKVDHSDEKIATKASGYFRSTAIQSYIVMPPPPDGRNAGETEAWKCTLVHEATHAFLFRYVSDKKGPTWLNEGLADVIACQVMGSRLVEGRMRQANSEAVAPGGMRKATGVFTTVGLTPFEYGIAQSWVRFLAGKEPRAFLRFVTLCKQGKDDEEAMKEAFRLSRNDFLKAWSEWAKTMR
jgi:formylglycine-generating enzyme required for sulfatase activity